MLKFIKRPKTPWITLKNMAFSQGNQLFAGDFHTVLDELTLIQFNLQRDGIRNGLSNIKDNFAESFQLQMSVLHLIMCIFKVRLSGLSDGWANMKKKVPDVSDFNQNADRTWDSKLNFTEFKNLFIKRVQKYQLNLNYVNTAVLELRIFGARYHVRLQVSDYSFILKLKIIIQGVTR